MEKIILEGAICGALTLTAVSALDYFNLPQSLSIAIGGALGFVGVEQVKAMAGRVLILVSEVVMQTSDKGIALIKEFEGCKLTAYQDSVGVWTIGYGWTQPVDGKPIRTGMTINQDTAERLLKTGLVSYENDVTRLVKVSLTQGQFDALVAFTYNLGARSLSTSTLLRKLNAGDYSGAADEFLRWNKAGGKVLNGLTRRRMAERQVFLA
jgi:GH24 family phage-related lysozyme (muramidase)